MLLTALVIVLVIPVTRAALKAAVHNADVAWFDEGLQDAWGRLALGEDWAHASPLRQPQDYGWLIDAGPAPVRIAHALGDSGGPEANSVAAMRRAVDAGIRLLEVDLSLESSGELRCAHDPGTPRAAQACTFESLMAALPDGTWLVLDIKSDFAETGERVVHALRANGRARQVVFQLYRPEDMALFERWQAQLNLPGPIVTAYLSHRSVDTVARESARLGVRAFTLPMSRLAAFSRRPDGLSVFVHPVHDCGAWHEAQAAHARGIYTRTEVRCGHG
ncbi:glycerophosphodiester phosphodiesterase [Ideonella oryzae]|uniref:Glycerophosphodiester phosphodiesterase n=1 Tax=Ideonella oryzae TaxID=2937441 RepID=A0ABT1BI45_9BURK|nr:glycerophosphodiester phosphodiesterase [Ideonella oryzae]MCO5975778.1 glycerophosphodiester phosphodiesterase [Ideonella oryzae]